MKTTRSRVLTVALAAAASTLPCTAANAEPYMALRDGWACSACHTNVTGGGMRNLSVELHAAEVLRLPNGGKGIFPEVDKRFSPNINEYFSVGADLRVVDTLLFQDDPNDDGRVPNNTAFRPLKSNSLDVDQATVYADLRLLPEYFNIYVDQRFAPGGATNREAWAKVSNVLPLESYLKGGQFFPAWGLRLQDDSSFVNQESGLGFNRNLQGLELGHAGESLTVSAQVADGRGSGTFPQLVGSASYMWNRVGPLNGIYLGASAAYDEPDDGHRGDYTAFGGFSVGPLALLGQGVLTSSQVADADAVNAKRTDQQWIAYGEANWLFFGWMNAKVAFDWTDPSDETGADARNRLSFGLEPFLDEYLQLRLFYRVYNGPKNDLQANRDELKLEAHVFF